VLRVTGLSKTFATGEGRVAAVEGVSFEIKEGELYSLLGPSGCGKTTTLRCIAGLERPSEGEIQIGETVVARAADGIHLPAHRREIGMVFQSYAIWPHLDVFENVAYPLRVARPRPSRREVEERTMAALALVKMEDLARRSATQISGGQQQRVALARALVRRPRLLLLDEPLSNLDALLREQMRCELEEMVSRVAVSTLYVTHDQSEALSLSHRLAVMSSGRIIQQGEPREVYDEPANDFVASFLGGANFLSASVEDAGENGMGILELDGSNDRLQLPLPEGCLRTDRLDVMFRPEHVQVALTPPAERTNVLEGVFERLSFLGARCEGFVRLAPGRVRLVLPPTFQAPAGAPVWLRIDPQRCRLFPKPRGPR